jgi:hypothetical protein
VWAFEQIDRILEKHGLWHPESRGRFRGTVHERDNLNRMLAAFDRAMADALASTPDKFAFFAVIYDAVDVLIADADAADKAWLIKRLNSLMVYHGLAAHSWKCM